MELRHGTESLFQRDNPARFQRDINGLNDIHGAVPQTWRGAYGHPGGRCDCLLKSFAG